MTISFQELPGPMFLKQPDFNIVFCYYLFSQNVKANVFKTRRGQLFFKQVGAGPDLYFRLPCTILLFERTCPRFDLCFLALIFRMVILV